MLRNLLLILAACAFGVSVSFLLAGRAQSSGRPDCAGLSVPVNSDYNLTYDAEQGLLQIQYTDAAGSDQTIEVDVRAPGCRRDAGIRAAIQHADLAQADHIAGACASIKEALASGATTARGRPLDRGAGQKFVAKHCG